MISFKKLLRSSISKLKNKYSIILVIGIICILFLSIAKEIIISKITLEWPIIEKEKNEKLVTDILSDIKLFQENIASKSSNIINDKNFQELIQNYNSTNRDQNKIFSFLTDHGNDDNYEIIDTTQNTVGWIGRRSYILKKQHFDFKSIDTSFISTGAIYSYYIYISKIVADKKINGYLVSNKIISTNYSLNNRYLKSAGFETELQNKYNIPIKFYLNKTPLYKKGFIIKRITDSRSKPIGYVEISGYQSEIYLEKINDFGNAAIFTLIILLFIILSFYLSKYYFYNPTLLKIILFTAHIWIFRYLLIFTNYFNLIHESGLFSRMYYSSPFGFGFGDSLGDISISNFFVFINLFYLYYTTSRLLADNTSKMFFKSKWSIYPLFFVSEIFLLLIIRAFGAGLRSLVFDSSLKLYDFRSIIPSYPVALMYINVFILGISIFIIAILILLPQIRFIEQNKQKGGKKEFFILPSLLISATIIYYFFESSPQVNIFITSIIILMSILLSHLLYKRVIRHKIFLNFRIGLILFLSGLIVSFLLFNEKIDYKQRQEIERKGEELTRPIDDYISYVMNKMMTQLSIDETIVPLLSSFDYEANYDEAFIRWLNSPLSQEKYNSAFLIFDKNGKIISQFSVGILDNDIRLFARDVQKIDQSMINLYQVGNSSLKHYIGIEPFYDGDTKIGTIVIIIASDENIFLRNSSPDYLRTYSTDEKFSEMQNIVISEFYNSQLFSSTNTIYSKEQRLSPEIAEYFSHNEHASKGLWITEDINERTFHSYYITANIKQPSERIYSLSIENLDLRWHLYNFFKILFINTALIILIAFIYILFKIIKRERVFLNFRTKILLSLLSLSLIPIMILWFYTETYIENQNQRTLIRNLSSDIDILGNNLLKHFGGVIDSTSLIKNLTLNDARNISESSGRDFNVYFYDSLIVSSRPEMYQTELVSRYISSNAYLQLFILGKNFYYENATIGNFPYLVGYVPITSSYGKTIGVLSVPVIYKDSLTERDLAQSLAFIFGGYILVFFMILVIGYYLSKIISTPIRNLTNATRNIISGDLDTQIPITGQDEISELIISFNKMTTELKENQKELAKAEREAAWKEMARQVAHEIKNPLTPMKLSVQHLQRINKDKAENFNEIFNRVTKTLLEQIDTLTKIVSGFSHFAKMPDRNIGKCNIHEIITQAINLLKEEKAIDFEVKFCDNVKMIDGDSEELRRVFINIIRNSIQAINAKETKNGKISIATVCSGKQILIKIHDNGIGIPSDIIPKIFDVNFSTKKEGMGIGLKISRKTIRDFGGDIRISSIENQGTTVEITL